MVRLAGGCRELHNGACVQVPSRHPHDTIGMARKRQVPNRHGRWRQPSQGMRCHATGDRLGPNLSMKTASRWATLALLLVSAGAAAEGPEANAPAAQLAQLINTYRSEQGLPPVALSPSLTRVARAHVDDLEQHPPSGRCNGHSWSLAGAWTACCYTSDHAQAQCMWDKPKEITRGAYAGPGFEIVTWASAGTSPSSAMSRWKASAGHASVILNRGVWATSRWQAMGVALSAHHAVVWFGEAPDTAEPR